VTTTSSSTVTAAAATSFKWNCTDISYTNCSMPYQIFCQQNMSNQKL